MDTEGLSFQQACAAIGRGECVQGSKLETYGPNGWWHPERKDWCVSSPTIQDLAPYKIVPDPSKQEEPKRSLTYAEALECEKVRIHWPENVLSIHNILERTNDWDIEELSALDLAERRNYRMEKVD